MTNDHEHMSRRDLIRLGATGVAAASIASLPVLADEKSKPGKLP